MTIRTIKHKGDTYFAMQDIKLEQTSKGIKLVLEELGMKDKPQETKWPRFADGLFGAMVHVNSGMEECIRMMQLLKKSEGFVTIDDAVMVRFFDNVKEIMDLTEGTDEFQHFRIVFMMPIKMPPILFLDHPRNHKIWIQRPRPRYVPKNTKCKRRQKLLNITIGAKVTKKHTPLPYDYPLLGYA